MMFYEKLGLCVDTIIYYIIVCIGYYNIVLKFFNNIFIHRINVSNIYTNHYYSKL